MAADGHDAGLAALAEDARRAVGEIDIGKVQTHEFREPQPRGVEQLHDGLVAHR